MKVKILNNICYQTYPLTDDMIEIDDNQLKEIGKTLQFVDNKIVPYTPQPDYSGKIENLKKWFDKEYARKEQKYRRLYTLKLNDDDGISGYDKLIALYKEAEIKRKQIQELELQINNKENEYALSEK